MHDASSMSFNIDLSRYSFLLNFVTRVEEKIELKFFCTVTDMFAMRSTLLYRR